MDGIPIVYQGQEQHFSGGDDPANREALWPSRYDTTAELYEHIQAVNGLRAHAIAAEGSAYTSYQAYPIQQADHILAVRKGAVVVSSHWSSWLFQHEPAPWLPPPFFKPAGLRVLRENAPRIPVSENH